MVSIHIAINFYNTDEYFNEINYWISDTRLNFKINQLDELNGVLKPLNRNARIKEIKVLKLESPYRFFYFRESDFSLKSLAYEYRKKNTIICLGPDGYKPYGEINKKHEYFSMILDTIRGYRLLLNVGLILPRLFLSRNYRYGSSSILNEVFLHHPDMFDAVRNRTKADIIKIPEIDDVSIDFFSRVFGVDMNGLADNSNVMLYVNQPFWSEELLIREMEILREIQLKFSNKKLIIKLHPTTGNKTIDRYRELNDVKIIPDNLPAELYISQLKHSIIFSGWSTALLFNTKTNNYYFTHSLFHNVQDKVFSQIKITPFPHINMIKSIDEMIMPSIA